MDVFSYELNGQSPKNLNHFDMRILEDLRGRRVGYFQLLRFLYMNGMTVAGYELKPGASWLDVTPSMVRYVWETGAKMAKRNKQVCNSFRFMLGAEHPAYVALGDALPAFRPPYAWYLRVPDLPGFIRHIAPALEKRLAESIAAGFSGELRISFYRDGLHLVFARGRLKTVEAWKPKPGDNESAAFPDLTFLQLLFGYRSMDELRFAFKDCYWSNNTTRVMLDALFPKRLSDIFAIY